MSLFVNLLAALAVCLQLVQSLKVSFDGRSFLVDGERKLFISGSIHYPRAPRSEWTTILQQAKDNGINLIQTYVFWDIHEPQNNVWNYPSDPSSNEDLVAFVQEAAKLGLYVHLRIAGYICAEWNFGGLPAWLRSLDTTLRTYDAVWMEELSQFVEKTISVVKDAGLLADVGGPIVMLQIENEYGNMESNYGWKGRKYVQWLSDYALGLDVGGVPWVMCQQGEGVGTAPAKEIVNACNGFYCDNWISDHTAAFPDQPHMWTENWPGWFQNWGEPVPHRPAVDVAFAVARWFARGGSYMNYYMAHGGSTYGRKVGGPLIVTSYDYDVQINEYGMRAEPKFTLLQQLHSLLQDHADVLLAHLPPDAVSLTDTCESHTYSAGDRCLVFLSNWGERDACEFTLSSGAAVSVPTWSVSIANGANCSTVVYNSKTTADDTSVVRANAQVASEVAGFALAPFEVTTEPLPSLLSSGGVRSLYPQEQLSVTGDDTDYLWYTTTVPTSYDTATNVTLDFLSGTAGGGLFYFFVNGQFAASTLGDAGSPPLAAASSSSEGVKSRRRTPTGWAEAAVSDKSTVVFPIAAGAVPSDPVTFDPSAVSVQLTLPAGPSPRLDILSISMGLKNYGPFLETIQVGIVSNLTLDGAVLTGFTHTVGLAGETVSARQSLKDSQCSTLCWYHSSFATPASVTAASHLALDLGTVMGKGSAYVNGHMLGRYWNITATPTAAMLECKECVPAEYVGAYSSERCRTGCGEPSQRYYKLPVEWLNTDGSDNSLVLFEELGGAPEKVKLVEISMVEV